MAKFAVVLMVVAAYLLSFGRSYAITGVVGGVNQFTGQRPARQDFSTFKNSGPHFDLYILSLQRFQQANQTSLLSYYEVAGNVSDLPTDSLLYSP